MPDEEMIERSIQACEDRFKVAIAGDTGKIFDELGVSLPNRNVWRWYVIAIIKAMREPTEKMKLAGMRSMQDYDDSLDCWYATIDEILK